MELATGTQRFFSTDGLRLKDEEVAEESDDE